MLNRATEIFAFQIYELERTSARFVSLQIHANSSLHVHNRSAMESETSVFAEANSEVLDPELGL